MLTIKTVKSKPKKPFHLWWEKGRGKKLAAELLLKAIANNEIKALFAESPNSMVRKTKGLNSLIFENLKTAKNLRYS
jgi:hypothetical protein